jgi:Tfp pilus assembly protein PilN
MIRMSKLRLDYQNVSPFPWVGVLAGGFALIILVMIALYFVRLRDQVDELENYIARTTMKKAARASNVPTTEKGRIEQTLEVKNANEVLHHLSVPWEALFKGVESSGGNKITLLSLEPDFEKKQVKISGEAENYNTVMSYLTELGEQQVFDAVFLQNHDIRQEDPDKPVRFTLLANWRDTL